MPRFETLTLATTDQLNGGASALTVDGQVFEGDGNPQDYPMNLHGFDPGSIMGGRCIVDGLFYVRQAMGPDLGTASLSNALVQYNPIPAWDVAVQYFQGQLANNDSHTFRANIGNPNVGLPGGPTVADHTGWDDLGAAQAGEWHSVRAGVIDVQPAGGIAPFFANDAAFPALGASGPLLTVSTTVANGQAVEVHFNGTIRPAGF